MKPRQIAWVTLANLLFTLGWVATMIISAASGGGDGSYESALALEGRLDFLHAFTYINAAFITLVNASWLALLTRACRPFLGEWAEALNSVFIPVYATLNLVVYLSQVSLVPLLIEMTKQPELQAAAELGLRLSLQQYNGSAIAFFNVLAYAINGLPSILLGAALFRHSRGLARAGAAFLLVSGLACWQGLGEALMGWSPTGVVVGGFLFAVALALLAAGFWKAPRPTLQPQPAG
jgi:hypothetical protein